MADNSTIETIKAVGAIITPITLAWIAYLQIGMGKKQNVIHNQINGMQEKMVVAEKAVSKAEGKEEQRKETKEEGKTEVVDVKIVDQEKVIKVGIEEKK